MTRMNYSLSHSRDLSSRGDIQPARRKIMGKKKSFAARYDGICCNCHGPITKGDLITIRKDHRVVHGAGCPAKARTG